jgi:hypothetical protein
MPQDIDLEPGISIDRNRFREEIYIAAGLEATID